MSVDMTRSFAFTFCTTDGGNAIVVQKYGSGAESFSAGTETECRHRIGIESWGDNKVDNKVDNNAGGDNKVDNKVDNNVLDHTENIPVRKRLNHRGPLSVDVSSAWYFIKICANGHTPWVADEVKIDRAVAPRPPMSDVTVEELNVD